MHAKRGAILLPLSHLCSNSLLRYFSFSSRHVRSPWLQKNKTNFQTEDKAPFEILLCHQIDITEDEKSEHTALNWIKNYVSSMYMLKFFYEN